MDERYVTPFKRVHVPIYGPVEMWKLREFVNHDRVQELRFKRQLGTMFVDFPGANHNRFEHTMGVLAQAREFAYSLEKRKMLEADEVRALELAAILHDVGHGPFSHVVERLAGQYDSRFPDHNARTDAILEEEFAKSIEEETSVDVRKVIKKEHPLSQLVSHKTLGADKISYMRLDQHHVGRPQSPLELGDLADNLVFLDGLFGVDERMAWDVRQIQTRYFDMYTQFILGKDCRRARVLSKRRCKRRSMMALTWMKCGSGMMMSCSSI